LSKILEATCEDGEVTVEGDVLDPVETTVLSQGVALSDGIVIIQGGKAYYLANNSGDLKTALETLSDALDAIAGGLSSLDSAGFLIAATGGVPGPPVAAGDIASINSAKTAVDNLLGALK